MREGSSSKTNEPALASKPRRFFFSRDALTYFPFQSADLALLSARLAEMFCNQTSYFAFITRFSNLERRTGEAERKEVKSD
jgi:hypothetical protein